MEEILREIIKALNLVEVKGADNLDRLLASIQTIGRICDALHNKAVEEAGQNDHNNE